GTVASRGTARLGGPERLQHAPRRTARGLSDAAVAHPRVADAPPPDVPRAPRRPSPATPDSRSRREREKRRRRAAASALRVRHLPGARPRAGPPALEVRTVHAGDPALLGVLERGSGEVRSEEHTSELQPVHREARPAEPLQV